MTRTLSGGSHLAIVDNNIIHLHCREALKKSDNKLTEQMMIEDKLKATDWEATDVAVAEQVTQYLLS